MVKESQHKKINQFRFIALLEGISLLILFGIAMPLKYMAGMPLAVQVVGWIHGVLFVMFCAFLGLFIYKYKMSLKDGCMGLVASLLPFGTFFFDSRIKRTRV